MNLFERILHARGITPENQAAFLTPSYEADHDPFLLPDMQPAVERLIQAHKNNERITIYGDYDIDGLTATTVLLDSLEKFGFKNVTAFIPNRFTEGYGLTVDAVERIAKAGADLILTVDCGSLSHKEITRAAECGIDVIVTDHHNVAPVQPPAVAVINPKRLLQDYPDEYENFMLKPDAPHKDAIYPFLDLPGVGVAFKLVQALQTVPVFGKGLPKGQEKWLLDLVALGTVCDVVTLVDENRTHVYWGLTVMQKTRRKGLQALMAVSNVRPEALNARSLGFALGPRMNAAGRLETAQYSLDMLIATSGDEALQWARKLDEMNQRRRHEQDDIFKAALVQAEALAGDPVLVVSAEGWNHGVVGIVAAKLLEKYHKPTFVLGVDGDEAKGSARSYGDFSAADAIRSADNIITKGGGHKLAAGVTIPTANIDAFRQQVNAFYASKNLTHAAQETLLLPHADTDATLDEVTEKLVDLITTLEPFGNGNPQPVLRTAGVTVYNQRRMGQDGQHLKLTLHDATTRTRMDMLAFNAPDVYFAAEPGRTVTVWYAPEFNDWNGMRRVEGKLQHLELGDD